MKYAYIQIVSAENPEEAHDKVDSNLFDLDDTFNDTIISLPILNAIQEKKEDIRFFKMMFPRHAMRFKKEFVRNKNLVRKIKAKIDSDKKLSKEVKTSFISKLDDIVKVMPKK